MNRRINGVALTVVVLAAMLGLSATARAQAQTQGQGQWERQGQQGQQSATRRAKPTTKQRPTPNERTKGLMLGVHSVAARGLTLSGGAFEAPYSTNFGMGAGAMIGYGFNRTVSSYVALDIAKQSAAKEGHIAGSYGLGHLEIGARTNLPVAWPNTVPYVNGSIGRRALGARAVDDDGDQADVSIHGRMVGLGVGIEHFLSPTLSFDGGVQLAFGKLDNLELAGRHLDLPVDGSTSTRLRLGITWRPRMKRT